jgi:hypothetical protein
MSTPDFWQPVATKLYTWKKQQFCTHTIKLVWLCNRTRKIYKTGNKRISADVMKYVMERLKLTYFGYCAQIWLLGFFSNLVLNLYIHLPQYLLLLLILGRWMWLVEYFCPWPFNIHYFSYVDLVLVTKLLSY